MALGTMRRYATWWAILRPTLLGMDKEDEDEDMVATPLEGASYEDKKN